MPDKQRAGEKRVEQVLSHLGAKVAKATEKAFFAKQQAEEAQALLEDVQTEIADLYERLDDLLSFQGSVAAK